MNSMNIYCLKLLIKSKGLQLVCGQNTKSLNYLMKRSLSMIFDAILMLNKSWCQVTTETIGNCFIKCGFSSDAISYMRDETPEIGCNSITKSLGVSGLEFQDFVTIDDNIIANEFGSVPSCGLHPRLSVPS